MKKWKILVTPKEACDALAKYASHDSSEVEFIFTHGKIADPHLLKEQLNKVDGVILDTEVINHEILRDNNQLKIISRFGVGYDSIHLDSLREKNISLAITYAASADAVARHALSLFLASQHNLIEHKLNAISGKWNRIPNESLGASPIGIIGNGNIAKAFVGLIEKLGYKSLIWSRSYGQVKTLEELILKCKIISIHLPLTDDTRGLIDHQKLKLMNQHTLINTSRGGIVVEEDLLLALEENNVKTYATDVFSKEPFAETSLQVARHSKVICSPHLASFDNLTAETMSERAFTNCLYYLKKENSLINKLVVSYDT